MGIRCEEAAALGERSSALETEPGIGEGPGIREIPPELEGGYEGEGEPWVGEGTQTGRRLGNVRAFGFGGKVVWRMQRRPHGGEGAGLGVGLRIREGALGIKARRGAGHPEFRKKKGTPRCYMGTLGQGTSGLS